MDKYELQAEICKIAENVLQKKVGLDTKLLLNGGYIDSMNIMEIVSDIEKRFNISFEDDLTLDYLDDIESLTSNVYIKVNCQ